jgi:O-antigen/teichoic acid export membrane protein
MADVPPGCGLEGGCLNGRWRRQTTARANPKVSTVVEVPSRFGAKRLYRDAGALVTASIANAALGMVFWAFAAKILPPAQLGVMTAVLSVIVSTGVVVAAGVGYAYIALLPAVGEARRVVFRRGQRVFLTLSLIAAVGAAIATTLFLREVRGSVGVAILVAVGTLAWAAFTFQSPTLTSLGRARWLPSINIVTSSGKIALLALLAATVRWHSVELAFVIPAIAVVIAVQGAIVRAIDSDKDLPSTTAMSETEALAEFNRLVIRTLTITALSYGVLTMTPFMVTIFAGPSQGALFALSLSIVRMLDLVGEALGNSFVVHGASTPALAGKMARAVLIKTAILATSGAVLIAALVPIALRFLNPQYGAMGAAWVITVLCIGSVTRTGYTVWAAIQLVRRNMTMVLAVNFVSGVLLLAVMPGLSAAHGAIGGAFAMLLAQSVLSAGALVHFIITRHARKDQAIWLGTVG